METTIVKTMDALIKTPSNETAQMLCDQIMDVVEANSGDGTELLYLAQLTCVAKAVDAAIKKVRADYAVPYMEKGSEKTMTAFGVDFTLAETGVKYDYTSSEKWCKLRDKMKDLKKKQEEIELKLRNRDEAVRTSTTSVTVKLK